MSCRERNNNPCAGVFIAVYVWTLHLRDDASYASDTHRRSHHQQHNGHDQMDTQRAPSHGDGFTAGPGEASAHRPATGVWERIRVLHIALTRRDNGGAGRCFPSLVP